jgi:hypothetical protein
MTFSTSLGGKHCADFEWNDNECSDAGDCWRGKCICDEKFGGFKCQLARKELSLIFQKTLQIIKVLLKIKLLNTNKL